MTSGNTEQCAERHECTELRHEFDCNANELIHLEQNRYLFGAIRWPKPRHSAVAVCLLAAMMFAIKLHGSTNRWNREMFSILSEDKVAELARQLDNGLSPNEEYGSSGSFPEELALPLLSFALHYKAERCASLLLERGASVTRPDGFHKIAIQWAEEAGMATIADTIERLNVETNLLVGLDITNAIKRLFPPGSLITPPADVPLTVCLRE